MKDLKELVELFLSAEKITVLTGAGVSTSSGIPDYRSSGGLWDGKKPEEIITVSKIGTPAFYNFIVDRKVEFDSALPNDVHHYLVELQEDFPLNVITQNIDGLHTAAGSLNVVEAHGHMRHLECQNCKTQYDWSKILLFEDDTCELCEGSLRPPVVLFGENIPQMEWVQSIGRVVDSDLILVLGTSLQVSPFNSLVNMGINNNAKIAIVTNSETPYDDKVDFVFNEDLKDFLKRFDKQLMMSVLDIQD